MWKEDALKIREAMSRIFCLFRESSLRGYFLFEGLFCPGRVTDEIFGSRSEYREISQIFLRKVSLAVFTIKFSMRFTGILKMVVRDKSQTISEKHVKQNLLRSLVAAGLWEFINKAQRFVGSEDAAIFIWCPQWNAAQPNFLFFKNTPIIGVAPTCSVHRKFRRLHLLPLVSYLSFASRVERQRARHEALHDALCLRPEKFWFKALSIKFRSGYTNVYFYRFQK